ncbi:apolipoprotein N-acyltransferase [Mesorhizobium sp. 1B3]|uniref:apolipoprotein N-acyltransferase n=1 Tax=Mesorhizobium sp. 1B3 TaxID=3243599 RepID=UPI003D95B7FE
MERLAGRLVLLSGWRRALVAFAAGGFAVLSVAPYDFFAACFVSFPVLVWLLDGATAEPSARALARLVPAFSIGWWFGFGYFVFGLWWVGMAMLVEADSFAWALPIAVLVLPAIMSVFYGLATALARAFWTDDIGRIAALAAAFGLAEWLRSFVFTGFPWNPIGYAAMPVPLLMQSVAVVGAPGMNSLSVFVFAMPALLAGRRHRRIGGALAAVLVLAHLGFGFHRLAPAGDSDARTLTVRIVQPSIDQATKLDGTARDDVFRTLLRLSAAPPQEGAEPPQLILWPETSVPFLFTERPDALTALGQLLGEGQMLIAGAVRAEGKAGADQATRYYNSVVAINDVGEIVDAVDKIHLVPGGEYLPFEGLFQRLGVDRIVPMPLSFSAGTERHAVALPGGLGAAPFICYEIIFPDLVSEGVAGADLVINVTNDGWFGDTPGPYQHFRQAQIRAVETGRTLVRAANTGISGVIDGKGRVIDALAINVRDVIDISVMIGPPRPMPWGNPTTNGLVIMALLATIACGLKLRQRMGVD